MNDNLNFIGNLYSHIEQISCKKYLALFFTCLLMVSVQSQNCYFNDEVQQASLRKNTSNHLVEFRNDTIIFGIHLEIDYKAYSRLGKSTDNVHEFVELLTGFSKKIFNKAKVDFYIDSIYISNAQDEYYIFDENTVEKPALIGALEVFHEKYDNDISTDVYYYIGGEPVYAGGVAISNIYGNTPYIGFGGQNFAADADNLFVPLDAYVFCHEVGHILGLPHTHYCDWGPTFTESIDDCGNKINTSDLIDQNNDCRIDDITETEGPGICYDPLSPTIPYNGGTIMSYCHALPEIGINYELGFGEIPSERMYSLLKVLKTDRPIHINSKDKSSLDRLYSSLNGTNWKQNSGWSSSTNLRDYYGISIEPRNGRVSAINLNNNNLEGEIPDLDGFDYLEEIDLSSNKVTGELNEQFHELRNLKKVILYNNQIQGDLNDLKFETTKLTGLFLSNNMLHGEIPDFESGKYDDLFWLSLGYNNFSGPIPKSIGNLYNLGDLGLQNNNLSGELPQELGNLSLRQLGLENNNLSGCFSPNLSKLCKTLSFAIINKGNAFETTWEEFCANPDLSCMPIDLDKDGYSELSDCDDDNDKINPSIKEIPYNGIDDDCDPETLDDDLDQDCFLNFNDCDDLDPNVNPMAKEIPNNGIDDDCLDGDLVSTSIYDDEIGRNLTIYPNPANSYISLNSKIYQKYSSFEIFDFQGKLIKKDLINSETIDISEFKKGIYILKLANEKGFITSKFIVID